MASVSAHVVATEEEVFPVDELNLSAVELEAEFAILLHFVLQGCGVVGCHEALDVVNEIGSLVAVLAVLFLEFLLFKGDCRDTNGEFEFILVVFRVGVGGVGNIEVVGLFEGVGNEGDFDGFPDGFDVVLEDFLEGGVAIFLVDFVVNFHGVVNVEACLLPEFLDGVHNLSGHSHILQVLVQAREQHHTRFQTASHA